VKICASFRINWTGKRDEDKKKAQYYDSEEIDVYKRKEKNRREGK